MSRKQDDKQGNGELTTLRNRVAELEKCLTDRQKEEEARHDMKNYLDVVIQTSHDGIFVVDSEGRFEFGNEAFFRILGWPKEELLGHDFIKVVPPDLHDFILERWEEVQAGKGTPYEVDILQKDSTRRSLLVSHRHMTIAGQRKYCVITKDITERKAAETAQRLHGEIAAIMPGGIVLVREADGVIVYANTKYEETLGYEPGELVGKHISIVNAPTDSNPEQIAEEILDALASNGSWQGEVLNMRKDGTEFWSYSNVSTFDHPEHGRVSVGVNTDITIQKRAEEALRESAELNSKIISESPIGIAICDEDGQCIATNEAMGRIVGATAEQVLEQNYNTIESWRESGLLDAAKRASRQGKTQHEVLRLTTTFGKDVGLECYIVPFIREGAPCLMFMMTDITKRQAAEETVRFLGLITRQVSDSVLATNLDFEITYANRSFERLFGYSQEEILGRFPDILNAEPDAERIQRDISETVSSGGVWRGELLNRRKDGSTFPCEMTIFPLVDDEGNTFAYAGNQRDITERRQAEEALRQSKERFDLAVRGSSDGLWDWSAASGHPVWWSPRVYELLGYEDGEIRGTYEMWIEFLHPDDRASTLEAMNANVENDMPYDVEYRLRMKSGDYKWFRSRGVTIRDENGNPIRMAGSIQDIEDRKRAEDELARHRIHLEEIVQMRTRELTEAQATLRKVHRRLLNVSEAERRHLAAELHDSVGQKLVAMALGIQQIIMGCEDPAGLEAEIQALQNMGQQCTETIQEIRTICYGLYPPMLELTGLAGSLSQLGQSCEPAVSFQLQCDDSLVETRFDPEQEIALFRMAQEAVSNALKHSEATTISISLGRQADVLTMSICDDGIGFDTTSQLGQGLGLRSMTERARAIGGTIEINSQPGRTSVEVTLPVKPPQTPD